MKVGFSRFARVEECANISGMNCQSELFKELKSQAQGNLRSMNLICKNSLAQAKLVRQRVGHVLAELLDTLVALAEICVIIFKLCTKLT